MAVLHNIKNTAPDLAGVPSTLAPVVAACLAKNPADRPSVAALLSRPAVDDQPERREVGPERRDRWWLRRS